MLSGNSEQQLRHDEQTIVYWLHMADQHRIVARELRKTFSKSPELDGFVKAWGYRHEFSALTMVQGIQRSIWLHYSMAMECLIKALGLAEHPGRRPSKFGTNHDLSQMLKRASQETFQSLSEDECDVLRRLTNAFFDARYPAPLSTKGLEKFRDHKLPLHDTPADELYSKLRSVLTINHSPALALEEVRLLLSTIGGPKWRENWLRAMTILAHEILPGSGFEGAISDDEWVSTYIMLAREDGRFCPLEEARQTLAFVRLLV